MKPLTPQERLLLERTVAGDGWLATAEELQIAISLYYQGLLGCIDRSEEKGSCWFSYPPTAASALALRIDTAYRQTVDR